MLEQRQLSAPNSSEQVHSRDLHQKVLLVKRMPLQKARSSAKKMPLNSYSEYSKASVFLVNPLQKVRRFCSKRANQIRGESVTALKI
eukprot:1723456-Amphidinium_carterae.1